MQWHTVLKNYDISKYAKICEKNKTVGTYKGDNEDETAKKR